MRRVREMSWRPERLVLRFRVKLQYADLGHPEAHSPL